MNYMNDVSQMINQALQFETRRESLLACGRCPPNVLPERPWSTLKVLKVQDVMLAIRHVSIK